LQKKYGAKCYKKAFDKKNTWGEIVLTPSIIYSNALLELLGRYKQKRVCHIKALAHVTGGGIPGNITRVLGNYGAFLDNLWAPHDPMLRLQEMGKITDKEAYQVWNMGTGMILISDEFAKIEKAMDKHGIQARVIGEVTKERGVRLVSQGFFKPGKQLFFE